MVRRAIARSIAVISVAEISSADVARCLATHAAVAGQPCAKLCCCWMACEQGAADYPQRRRRTGSARRSVHPACRVLKPAVGFALTRWPVTVMWCQRRTCSGIKSPQRPFNAKRYLQCRQRREVDGPALARKTCPALEPPLS
ncbi:hypothetical protein KCP74_15490 [Salmonella enterica subsp. enterica]|nr:hypothetical protein KCP74_15490 [Salmonella enterica subsp. enterica]